MITVLIQPERADLGSPGGEVKPSVCSLAQLSRCSADMVSQSLSICFSHLCWDIQKGLGFIHGMLVK